MTSAQVVEMSVTNNSSFWSYPHPDDHNVRTTVTSGFKTFSMLHHIVLGKGIFKKKTFLGGTRMKLNNVQIHLLLIACVFLPVPVVSTLVSCLTKVARELTAYILQKHMKESSTLLMPYLKSSILVSWYSFLLRL